MGMTYICADCGTSLHGHTTHECHPITNSTSVIFHLYKDCVNEKTLREQIKREIEAKCISAEHQGNHNGMGALTSDPSIVYYPETFSVCGRCSVAAAIAGGNK